VQEATGVLSAPTHCARLAGERVGGYCEADSPRTHQSRAGGVAMSGKGDIAQLVAAAVAGKTLGEMAAVSGVSVSTVQRRLGDSEVAAEIRSARQQQQREVVGQLNVLNEMALRRLRDLISDEDAGVALRAVGLVLTNTARFAQVVDQEERLAGLEQAMETP